MGYPEISHSEHFFKFDCKMPPKPWVIVTLHSETAGALASKHRLLILHKMLSDERGEARSRRIRELDLDDLVTVLHSFAAERFPDHRLFSEIALTIRQFHAQDLSWDHMKWISWSYHSNQKCLKV